MCEDGLANPCLCADGQSLPFAGGNPGSESGGGDEMVARNLYATFQRTAQSFWSFVPGALQGGDRGWGGGRLFSSGQHLYSFESGAGQADCGGTGTAEAISVEQLPVVFEPCGQASGVVADGSGAGEFGAWPEGNEGVRDLFGRAGVGIGQRGRAEGGGAGVEGVTARMVCGRG